MRFEANLALKYFFARRKSLARFTSLAAITGIAAGVGSLILAQALARGFADEMQNKIIVNTAHVSIFTNDGAEISEWQTLKIKLETVENVEAISATVYESAAISGTKNTSYAVLRINENFSENESENQRIEVSIGKELAEKTHLKIGDEAEIITLGGETNARTQKVFVKNIFETGLYEYDSTWIYISTADYVRLNKRLFAPTILSVKVQDIYRADETAEKIRQMVGKKFKVVDWQEANQPLFAALSLERRVALAIISLIIFIAALNITTTLALLVNERRLDIAVLRTCGAKTWQLIFIFLFEGIFLGAIGIFLGTVFGLIGAAAGNYFQIVRLSKEIYSLKYVPFHVTPTTIFLIISVAFLICLAATVYPAYRASRIKPLENFRQQ